MPTVTAHDTTEMGSHIGLHSQMQLEPAGPEVCPYVKLR